VDGLWLFRLPMGILRAGGNSLPRILYSILFYALVPLVCLRLLWRGRRVPGYRRRWLERFGFVPPVQAADSVIWVHSVSVGETIAAAPLIRELQRRYQGTTLAVTTSTPTGSDRVRALFGDSVYHVYAPYDLPGAVGRFCRRTRPDLLIIMETELWPNLIARCRRQGIPVVVANARLSQKSADGYRRFRWLTGPMLEQITVVAAQSKDDGERFLRLGLGTEQLAVTGNIKFDIEITPLQEDSAQSLRRNWQGSSARNILLAASTHRGEDDIVLDAFSVLKQRFPELLLVLVPRHPDRFEEVAALCHSRQFSLVRRSLGANPSAETDILLGDTMGELPVFFGASDIAFVGGSLVPVGGHNLMEPAAWGRPVISGPHLFNFSEASSLLQRADALTVVGSADDFAGAVESLLTDEALAERRGRSAREVIEANRGAMAKLLQVIADLPSALRRE
jgi:3-deoxy-D-manno-octulosonic-acid transferase